MSGLLSRAGVQLHLTEGTLSWVVPFGTTHGSPYLYDRHVPWILYGAGIAPGVRTDRIGAVDVAPTLAGALGDVPPDDLDGADRMRPPDSSRCPFPPRGGGGSRMALDEGREGEGSRRGLRSPAWPTSSASGAPRPGESIPQRS